MFLDSETGELYAVTLGDEKENLQIMRDALKRVKTERELSAVYLEDYMRDFLILGNQMLLYPSNIGITDRVFKKQKTFYSNNYKELARQGFVN